MEMSAHISDCGTWRWTLERVWDKSLPVLVVCMLNPSTADSTKNDPTILALIHFARLWGYGGLLIFNLYAFRSSTPTAMMASDQRHSSCNREVLENDLPTAASATGRVLVAWGNDGNFEGEADWFANRMTIVHRLELICLGRTKSGAPKHPMARGRHRVPRTQTPIVWRAVPAL